MRHTNRAMLSVSFVACLFCAIASAQEERSRWWPFGGSPEPAVAADQTFPESTSLEPWTTSSGALAGPQLSSADPEAPSVVPPTMLSAAPPDSTENDRPWIFQSPFANLSWPEMPEFSLPRPRMPQLWTEQTDTDVTRNRWMEKSPEPRRVAPWETMSNGARRLGESTRSAWRKTVDVFTPGDDTPPRVATRDEQPSLWNRMFAGEKQAPQGPRTVTEWMSQDRLNP